ncbi:MAG: hypothetical protein HYX40_09160 [Sphingobacteriales bacterium]|nr:hypothetical protein [Sphingobacteriales bacterium]
MLPSDYSALNFSLTDYAGKTIKIWNNKREQKIYFTGLNKGFYLVKVASILTGEELTQKVTVF